MYKHALGSHTCTARSSASQAVLQGVTLSDSNRRKTSGKVRLDHLLEIRPRHMVTHGTINGLCNTSSSLFKQPSHAAKGELCHSKCRWYFAILLCLTHSTEIIVVPPNWKPALLRVICSPKQEPEDRMECFGWTYWR